MRQTKKALIVEDSDLQAELLVVMLNDLGIEDVTKADNGINGLDYFDRR